jgi:hypothetical protein
MFKCVKNTNIEKLILTHDFLIDNTQATNNQQQPTMSYTPAITALERTKLIHSGPDGVKAVQKLACRETILAMIEHREHRGAPLIVAYANNIGMKVQRALDYYGGESGNEPNEEAMSYYMDAVNILQKGGLLRFEFRAGTMYVSPTYAGYQWVERKMPGKYLEIVRKVIHEEKNVRARECECQRSSIAA